MTAPMARLKVLTAGIFSLVLMLGVARFAYTPLLPVMLEQTSLSHAAGGWLATLNYLGYLCGALIAASLNELQIKDRLYRLGLIVAVLTTVAMGLADNIWIWAASRFLAGLSSAAALLLGSGLILNWLLKNGHRGELGLHFSGIGLGIVLCSLVVELLHPTFDWRAQWLVFSALGLVMVVPAWVWLPRPVVEANKPDRDILPDNPPRAAFLNIFMAAYFCAGVGYVVSATFIVAIIDALPGLEGRGTWVFLVIGLAAAPASILWDVISRRTGHVNALILAFLFQIPAIALPLVLPTVLGAMISAIFFGFTFLGIVSLVLTMSGLYYPSKSAKMMGKMTISYGLAQILAPAVIGAAAKVSGGYDDGLYFAVAFVALGLVLMLVLKSLERQRAICLA